MTTNVDSRNTGKFFTWCKEIENHNVCKSMLETIPHGKKDGWMGGFAKSVFAIKG